jgi:hypothetical protein
VLLDLTVAQFHVTASCQSSIRWDNALWTVIGSTINDPLTVTDKDINGAIVGQGLGVGECHRDPP